MKFNIVLYILVCLLSFPTVFYSQPLVHIVRTDIPPVIDGVLSEKTWNITEPITEFVQRMPKTGEPVSERTEIYLLYDEDYLYIGIRCYDDPAEILGREMARNADLSNDDRVQIILDTHFDRRNAYWFQIGPRGSIGDAIISENGAGFNKDWQGFWEGKASIQSYGWEAEMAIPFKTLNFDNRHTKWGLKFIRFINRKIEISYWPSANLNSHIRQVSDAGVLTGLENISQGVGLDINPYVIAGFDRSSGVKSSPLGDAGLDVFYQVTPGLRGVLTLNTDFAETEVDSRHINLTRFSLHFPEKRDFFLDGANYFNFGIGGERDNPYNKRLIPFFSRRLGLDEDGEPLPIHAGTRLTGQAGDWNLGFINIFQEKQFNDGAFTTMRVSRNLGQQSSAGMITTFGNATGGETNALYGLDTKIATSNFAGDKNLSFIAYGLQSLTVKPGITRKTDNAYGVEFNYPNDLLWSRIGFMQIDEDFTAGMGFVHRKGIREIYLSSGIGLRPYKFGIRHIGLMGDVDYISDLHGKLQTREIDMDFLWVYFVTGETIYAKAVFSHENLVDEFNLMDRIIIPAGKYDFRSNNLLFETATKRNLWGKFRYGWGDFYHGTKKNLIIETGWYVFMHFYFGTEMEKRYLSFPEDNFDMGIYRFIMNVVFSPDINLFSFIQYDDITETLGWQSRFQWIIKPGREIVLAWNSYVNEPMERFSVSESSLKFKVKYNIRF